MVIAYGVRALFILAGFFVLFPVGSPKPENVMGSIPNLRLWPLPRVERHSHSIVFVRRRLNFKLTGDIMRCPVLEHAISKAKRFIFRHSHKYKERMPKGVYKMVQQILVKPKTFNDTLQFETDESYSLIVPDDGSPIVIESKTIYGAAYGIQTLSQLCTFDWEKKAVVIKNAPIVIEDSPRFKHRGLLVDTSRHYEPITILKQVIDSMAYAKLNVLHWHMVDEQSFPIETPSFPKLWLGSYTPQERFTLEEVKDLVKWAAIRGVKIMPEIDAPGHAESWGHGYPELWPNENCTMPLDVSKNFTFQVINGVMKDLRRAFTYDFFHVGGDEVNTSCWDSVPHVKDWMESNGYTTLEAYHYFVNGTESIADSLGWSPVIWEEPFGRFGESLHPNTIVHQWLTSDLAPEAVKAGFRVLISDVSAWYLDHIDKNWEIVYNFEPLLMITDLKEQALVLGGEVCMWGETVDPSNILATIWPRAAAAAERLWSPRELVEKGNRTHVLERLEWFRCLLNERGVSAAPVNNGYARAAPDQPGSCYVQ